MTQAEFATFIEDNLADIAGSDGLPSGADMLRMSIDFEAKQDMRFKSALRLQSGGVDLAFVQQEDNGTLEKMKLFDRFAIGVPVFWGDAAYRVEARLRYRVREGKLSREKSASKAKATGLRRRYHQQEDRRPQMPMRSRQPKQNARDGPKSVGAKPDQDHERIDALLSLHASLNSWPEHHAESAERLFLAASISARQVVERGHKRRTQCKH